MKKPFQRLRDLIHSRTRGRTVLILLVPTLAVYVLMLIWSIPTLVEYSGGMKIFDMQPLGYDYQYARSLLESLGTEGRQFYLSSQIPLDLIYPGLFALTYALLLGWLLRRDAPLHGRLAWLVLTPVFAGLFDYFENAAIFLMLTSYPDLSGGLVSVSNVFTLLKSGLTTLTLVMVIIGFAWMLRARRRRTPAPADPD